MSSIKIKIFWTENAKEDLREIYISLKNNTAKETACKIRDQLFNSPNEIVFAEQFSIRRIQNRLQKNHSKEF